MNFCMQENFNSRDSYQYAFSTEDISSVQGRAKGKGCPNFQHAVACNKVMNINKIDLDPKIGTYPSMAFRYLALCNHFTYFRHLYCLLILLV